MSVILNENRIDSLREKVQALNDFKHIELNIKTYVS